MALFLTTYYNKVDRKGRVSVPAAFRTALEKEGHDDIVVFPSFTSSALEGCSIDYIDDLADRTAESYDPFSPEHDDLKTLIFSSCHRLAWDPEGRVALPEAILQHAGITDQAAFVGQGRNFQIWEPEAYKIHEAEARARALVNRPPIPPRRSEGR
jgi:MraZ protein